MLCRASSMQLQRSWGRAMIRRTGWQPLLLMQLALQQPGSLQQVLQCTTVQLVQHTQLDRPARTRSRAAQSAVHSAQRVSAHAVHSAERTAHQAGAAVKHGAAAAVQGARNAAAAGLDKVGDAFDAGADVLEDGGFAAHHGA